MRNLINSKYIFLGNVVLLLLAYPMFYIFYETWNIDIAVYFGTIYIVGLMALLKVETASYFSPVGIFFAFYWIMLLGRPFLVQSGLIHIDIVEASASNPITIFEVNTYLVITVIAIGCVFLLINLFFRKQMFAVRIPEIEFNKTLKIILWIVFIVFGILMLKDGRTAYYTLQETNYIELIETGEIVYFNHIYYTLVKWAWFFLFIAYPKKSVLLSLLFILFLMALPVSGMRGYFILYLLMILMFLEGKRLINLKLIYIIPFIFGLLSLVTFLLEYRLGFSITEAGIMAPIYSAISAQGSTYEVIYGAYQFRDQINFVQNVAFPSLFNFPSFGYYIDQLRGVNFANDVGFATSAIAEIISGGILVWLVYLAFISSALNVLHRAFTSIQTSNAFLFTLFFIAPIVWGQPRGALLQLLLKFVFFLGLIFVAKVYKIKKIKI